MIDHYLWGRTDSISPEAPVPVIDVQSESEVLGGAGNVVNNLIALGADVSVASVIGKDENGKRLTKMLKSLGIHTDALIAEPERRTTRKSRVIASHQQVVRFDSETRQDITKESEDKILAAIQKKLLVTDIILLSDYGKGVLSDRLTKQIIQMVRANNVKVLVDPKGKDYSKYSGAILVTPNKKEASEATGIDIVDDESLQIKMS
jgi:D-beta-D-heptose 7-phosphate kinase/D-beta-D-heptose 1-phosphate adenosyltransferase